MNDNDIIKALECCGRIKGQDCDTCPLTELQLSECTAKVATESLDLINRQKAEIESLKHRKTELQIRNQELQHEKSEAIKEFVKLLKDRVVKKYAYTDVRIFNGIDNLVKEMIGEQNE